ncbi:MAG: transposase family protein [Anaerolineales bacterium]|nr:transposase family protein [Anaerolineales bacterium]
MLKTVQQAQAHGPQRSLEAILADLGLPRTTYFRWVARADAGQLADQVVVPQRPAIPPTPQEADAVVDFARANPLLGYKRLAYALMLEKKAFVLPWMVRDIMAQHELLGRRQPPPEALVRPPEADHPDQRWHTDLMVWWFADRWFWMIDVLDAYSRYLVHCQLLLTARAEDVTLAVQTALDTLPLERRRAGEPEIVHDNSGQFIGREWAALVHATDMTNVRARPHHPQSNGRDERVHRTFREEMPLDQAETFYHAQEVIRRYRSYYNERRPHSALRYLPPREFYRGDPTAALAARADACRAAAAARQAYWQARQQP